MTPQPIVGMVLSIGLMSLSVLGAIGLTVAWWKGRLRRSVYREAKQRREWINRNRSGG